MLPECWHLADMPTWPTNVRYWGGKADIERSLCEVCF